MKKADNTYGLPMEINDVRAVREALVCDLGAADVEEAKE
jgi:hypothetical protein